MDEISPTTTLVPHRAIGTDLQYAYPIVIHRRLESDISGQLREPYPVFIIRLQHLPRIIIPHIENDNIKGVWEVVENRGRNVEVHDLHDVYLQSWQHLRDPVDFVKRGEPFVSALGERRIQYNRDGQ